MVCSWKRSSFWNPSAVDEIPIDEQRLEPVLQRPFRDLGVESLARLDQRARTLSAALSRERLGLRRRSPPVLRPSTGTLHFGHHCVPSFAKSSRRK